MALNVAIVGAGGYSGAELAEILLRHSTAKIVGVYGSARREADGKTQAFSEVFGRFRGRLDLPLEAADVDRIAATKPDAVFLCTPHEASIGLAAGLVSRGIVVLDLSAAFRLKDAALYPVHYGFEHGDQSLLGEAVYGLVEVAREQIRKARLIAVPGCYPTSAILPLAPLAAASAIRRDADGRIRRPIIDSTSGVSGAGRGLHLKSLFCEVHQQPYGVLKHRHQPEIDAYAGVRTVFTPHLGAFERGILSTIHVDLADGWNESRVRELYAKTYGHERCVRLCPAGVWPSVADVRGTNFCDIALAVDDSWNHLIIASAIDNLVKGAAGQAVQCMNVRFGCDEVDGLLTRPGGAA